MVAQLIMISHELISPQPIDLAERAANSWEDQRLLKRGKVEIEVKLVCAHVAVHTVGK
jgi:hypothetical protein